MSDKTKPIKIIHEHNSIQIKNICDSLDFKLDIRKIFVRFNSSQNFIPLKELKVGVFKYV